MYLLGNIYNSVNEYKRQVVHKSAHNSSVLAYRIKFNNNIFNTHTDKSFSFGLQKHKIFSNIHTCSKVLVISLNF